MLRERASLAFTKIAEEPVKLADNSFYTPKQLGNLEEIDLALADFIFNRPFSEKSVSVLIQTSL
jgi:hypothetical protein